VTLSDIGRNECVDENGLRSRRRRKRRRKEEGEKSKGRAKEGST